MKRGVIIAIVVGIGVALWQATAEEQDAVGAPGGTGGAAPYGAETSVEEARDQLAALQVRPEDTGAHYDRGDWPHWSPVGDGCDTRDAVLMDTAEHFERGANCDIISGLWTDPYTGDKLTEPSGIDMDHLIPLAEAWL